MTPLDGCRSLLLAHDFPPLGGGIARALGEIARVADWMAVSTGRADAAGWSDARWNGRVVRSEVPADRQRTFPGLLRWRRETKALLRAHRFSFAWAGNLKPAGHVSARLGLPYGLIVYGQDLNRLELQVEGSRLRRHAARVILGRAAGTVAISRWTAARFRVLAKALGEDRAAERIKVIPLGADPVRFSPDGARRELGPGDWLVTVARLTPHKGVDTGLRVLAALASEFPGLRYAVAGQGPDRPRLERLADELGVTERVRWLGPVPDSELPSLYRSAAVYLGLSRQDGIEVEGFGLSLAEAEACGCPVIAGNQGGTADAVENGAGGVLVPPAEPGEATEAVRQLLLDPARRAALGGAGRARVLRQLNWSRVVADLAQAEQEFLASR